MTNPAKGRCLDQNSGGFCYAQARNARLTSVGCFIRSTSDRHRGRWDRTSTSPRIEDKTADQIPAITSRIRTRQSGLGHNSMQGEPQSGQNGLHSSSVNTPRVQWMLVQSTSCLARTGIANRQLSRPFILQGFDLRQPSHRSRIRHYLPSGRAFVNSP